VDSGERVIVRDWTGRAEHRAKSVSRKKTEDGATLSCDLPVVCCCDRNMFPGSYSQGFFLDRKEREGRAV
jgi:hypothetical protein